MSIYYDIYNRVFLTSGVIPDNQIGFHIPLGNLNTNLGIFCANNFDTNSLLISRSDYQYDAFIPQEITVLSLLIEPKFFQSYTDQIKQVSLDKLIKKNVSHLKVAPGRFMSFKKFLKNLCTEIEFNCQAVGANKRTLRHGFKAIFGLSPKQYLRIHRLNLAHRQLLRGNSTTKSVTDIAFDSGFWHLGRFSRDYKELFEELPVETLRKEVNFQQPLIFPEFPRYRQKD